MAGAVIGCVMYLVLKPLMGLFVRQQQLAQDALIKQLDDARTDRVEQCKSHVEFHQKTTEVLSGLLAEIKVMGNGR